MRYKELVSIYAILRTSICVMDLLLSLQQKHLLKTIFGRGLARRATSDSSKKKNLHPYIAAEATIYSELEREREKKSIS